MFRGESVSVKSLSAIGVRSTALFIHTTGNEWFPIKKKKKNSKICFSFFYASAKMICQLHEE